MSNIEAKERILQAARANERVTYRDKTVKITPDFSTQVRNARRDWYGVLWTLEENNFQPRLVYPAKLSFKIDGEIKTFHDKQTLKEFMRTKPTLEKILKEINHKEGKTSNFQNHRRGELHVMGFRKQKLGPLINYVVQLEFCKFDSYGH